MLLSFYKLACHQSKAVKGIKILNEKKKINEKAWKKKRKNYFFWDTLWKEWTKIHVPYLNVSQNIIFNVHKYLFFLMGFKPTLSEEKMHTQA